VNAMGIEKDSLNALREGGVKEQFGQIVYEMGAADSLDAICFFFYGFFEMNLRVF
jgi:hypothetical protein